jgi:adenine-specific DNA-methyltransferase
MIYPRLKVAKDLLSEDGVIFISIDDNEVNNAIKACDDVFGAINKIASLITINNPRGRQSDTFYATVHEYLLCYCRNREKAFINGMPLTDEQRSEYSYSDENGCYRLLGLRQRGSASLREDRPDMFFPIYVDPQTLEVSLERKDGWSVVIPKKSDGREGRWMWGNKSV